uniref:Rab-GAP TBC domain-containing protein n=1 Tax=Macrostomum lignano TaxID=282301 RepID=A0A1I8H5V3_9PLAT
MDDSYYDSIEPNAATTAGQQQQQLQSDSTSAAIKSPSVDLTLDSLDGDLDDDRRKDVADEDDFSHDLLSDDAAGVKECDCEDSLGATSSGAAKLRASVRQHVNHRGENMLLPNGSSRGSTPSTTAGGGAPRQRGLSSVRSQRHRQEESAAEKRRASLVERQRRLQGSTVSRDLAELDALGRVSAISDEQLVYLPHQSTGLPPQSVSRLPGGYTVLGPAFEESPVVPDFSAPLRNSSTVLATGAALNGARFGGSRKDVTDNAAPTTGTSAVAEECPECPRLRQRIGQLESQASSLLEQLSASRAVVEALTSATATGDAGGIARVDKALLAENRTLQAQLDAASAVGNDLEDVRRELRAAVAASSPAEAAELSARSRLLEQRCAELTQSCVDLRHANHQLQLSLGRVRGVLPDLSVADIELLERRWCDLPTSIGDQLEDGDILADRVRDEEGISDEHQVVQCLWYRHQVTKRSLSALQLRLASLGVSSANQLAHLDSLADSAAANAAEVERLRDQVAVKDDALRALEVSGGGGGGGSAGGGGISSSEANLSRVLASLERLDHLRPATAAAAAAAAATSSTTKEPPSAEVGELRNQLDVYREKLRMMADEKARLEEALQAASGLEETKRERDGIAANFDRALRSAVSERDAARHEASELRAQLEAERQRQQSERQQAESRGADLTALRRELELSRRVAANQEAEKDRLMEELKRLGSAAGSSESAVRELRARCDQTVGHLRKTLQLVSVPEEEADDDNDASIGTFDGKTRLELQRARQALEELERAARDAESVGVAATIGSGAPGASAAQAALESTRAAAAELRERLRAEERRRADEVGQLREALGASGARLRAERKRAEAAGREAEATARRLEAASAEAAALRACRDQAEQLRAELRDATARLDAARESNSQL